MMNEAPPAPTVTRQTVLAAAESLVMGQREQEYGSPQQSMDGIARFWNDYIRMRRGGAEELLDAHDVAIMLGLVKVARATRHPVDLDSYVDLAGYASIAAEVRQAKHKIAAPAAPQPRPAPSLRS